MVAAFDAGLPEVALIMVFVSVLTFVSMMKAYHLVFLRPMREPVAGESVSNVYVAALALLVGFSLLFGVYPEAALGYVWGVASHVGWGWVLDV